MGNLNCITKNSGFQSLCLDDDVLRVAYLQIRSEQKKRRKSVAQNYDNKARRWLSYKQCVFWIYEQTIGENIHKLLPSCVYASIRKKYPAFEGENNTHFKMGENENYLSELTCSLVCIACVMYYTLIFSVQCLFTVLIVLY